MTHQLYTTIVSADGVFYPTLAVRGRRYSYRRLRSLKPDGSFLGYHLDQAEVGLMAGAFDLPRLPITLSERVPRIDPKRAKHKRRDCLGAFTPIPADDDSSVVRLGSIRGTHLLRVIAFKAQ